MSQENLKLVRSISAAHERGDYGSAEWADPEIELFIVGGVPAGKAKGQAETSGMVREVSSEMELWRDEAEEYRELRDALPRAIARCLHTRWTPASLLAAAALLAGCGSATHATQPISTRAKHELLQEKYANERAKEESVKQKQRGLEEHHEAAERAAEARKEEQANAPSSHHYPPGLHAAFLRECYEQQPRKSPRVGAQLRESKQRCRSVASEKIDMNLVVNWRTAQGMVRKALSCVRDVDQLLEASQSYEVAVEEVAELGDDHVVAVLRVGMRGKASGAAGEPGALLTEPAARRIDRSGR